MLTQDKDEEEELVLFMELHHSEKDHRSDNNSNTMSSQPHRRRTAADNFLYSEKEKSDYEWLVSPPGSPSSGLMNQIDVFDAPDALKSQLGNYFEEKRTNVLSANQTTSFCPNSGIKRPLSSHSSRSTSRPSTPTKRPSSSGTSRATLTAARATTTSTAKQTTGLTTTTRSNNRPMTAPNTRRPSTPTGSSTFTRIKQTKPAEQTTGLATSTASNNRPMTAPDAKPGSRSGTPTRRPSTPTGSSIALKSKPAQQTTGSITSTRSNNRPMTAPNSKPGSRSGTPTRRPPTPPGSSTISKSKPTTKPVPSPIVRSRPWEPYEMPGFSLEAPSNLRTTLPDRPQTASSSSRGTRAFGGTYSVSSSRSASIEREVPRRQSCSPSRNRAPIGNVNGASTPTMRGRQGKSITNDGGLTSPVVKENMRKLAPPRVKENGGRGGGGGSTVEKSRSGSIGLGFGRNLSQSSIDMALRHLDIKRGSMTGNFRPSVSKVPATSLYSMRSQTKRPVSSSGNSESSVNILCLDGSDDNVSERSYS